MTDDRNPNPEPTPKKQTRKSSWLFPLFVVVTVVALVYWFGWKTPPFVTIPTTPAPIVAEKKDCPPTPASAAPVRRQHRPTVAKAPAKAPELPPREAKAPPIASQRQVTNVIVQSPGVDVPAEQSTGAAQLQTTNVIVQSPAVAPQAVPSALPAVMAPMPTPQSAISGPVRPFVITVSLVNYGEVLRSVPSWHNRVLGPVITRAMNTGQIVRHETTTWLRLMKEDGTYLRVQTQLRQRGSLLVNEADILVDRSAANFGIKDVVPESGSFVNPRGSFESAGRELANVVNTGKGGIILYLVAAQP